MAGYRFGTGVAPWARIGASKIFRCSGAFGLDGLAPSYRRVVEDAWDRGARISNNSWGEPRSGAYTTVAREYDSLVRDANAAQSGNQEMVQVFAAGNDGVSVGNGSIDAPGTAKNVITVGASENIRSLGTTDACGVSDAEANDADDLLDISSRGPTDDLRVKPDLVAPGTHVTGARPRHVAYTGSWMCSKMVPDGGSLYAASSGTSQAAPQVAGAAALIRQWYEDPDEQGQAPSPAMTKAILANTATDIAGGQDGRGGPVRSAPNPEQGWGRVNVGTLLDDPPRVFHDQGDNLLGASGESVLRTYAVEDSSRQVKVTLAWTDAPGMVGASAYVNNLDLVVAAGGRTYKGNAFAAGRSLRDGDADPRNNLESVYLPRGIDGSFSVRVTGTNIVGNGVPGNQRATDQDFAVVVSNAAETDPAQRVPVLRHDTTTLHPGAGADGDGALEPGEAFELDEQIRNAGLGGASNVSGTLSGPNLIPDQASSAWPDISPGAVQQNVTRFAGEIRAGVPCGAGVDAEIALEESGGSHTVPLVLPTGVNQAPAVNARSGSVAIPDNSSAGRATSVNVTLPGVVKDLDVRIGQITHPFVGDLRIELTGPDGTTVILAEHPGGPDNSGNNLTGTVFDDEAAENIASANAAAPFRGRFKPQNDQLARFDGKPRTGVWTLRVRDLAAPDSGTLGTWQTEMTRAACNGGPDTTVISRPASPSAARTATFGLAKAGGAIGGGFECRLDGGSFGECASVKAYTGLVDGVHTFQARAVDGSGNVDATAASYSWTVDAAPETAITTGPAGAGNGSTAQFAFRSEDPAAGFECRLDGAAFSGCSSPRTYSGLSPGSHSFEVRARDRTGHVDATPARRDWTVVSAAPENPAPGPQPAGSSPPSFVVAATEQHPADAIAGRLTLMAGCPSACRVSATLTASESTARRLGLAARAVSLGKGSRRLAAGGAKPIRIALSRRARASIRRAGRLRARLSVSLSTAGRTTNVLSQTLSLRRDAGLRRITRRGLRLAGACTRACAAQARLMLSARQARKIGLQPPSTAALELSTGRARGPSTKWRVTLRPRPAYRRALRRAGPIKPLLAMVLTGSGVRSLSAKQRMTLRR